MSKGPGRARAVPPAPQLKAVERQFPKIKITGGPSPANIVMTVDGVEVRKVFDVQLHAGVNEAVSAIISQFVEIDVEMEGLVTEGYIATVRTPQLDEEKRGVIAAWIEVARGNGRTLREAVMAAAEQIPEERPH